MTDARNAIAIIGMAGRFPDAPDLDRFWSSLRDGVESLRPLTDEELSAIRKPDIGLLYVLGVNGQLLMHYAALHKYPWDDYLSAMRDGVKEHGPVRAGLYKLAEQE